VIGMMDGDAELMVRMKRIEIHNNLEIKAFYPNYTYGEKGDVR